MGKPVSSDIKRAETAALNTQINKEILGAFKDCLKWQGYSMNIILEVFMAQYINGRFKLKHKDIQKFKDEEAETAALSTTFNKEIYEEFKEVVKAKDYYVKYVLTAFMEKYIKGSITLEYVENKQKDNSGG